MWGSQQFQPIYLSRKWSKSLINKGRISLTHVSRSVTLKSLFWEYIPGGWCRFFFIRRPFPCKAESVYNDPRIPLSADNLPHKCAENNKVRNRSEQAGKEIDVAEEAGSGVFAVGDGIRHEIEIHTTITMRVSGMQQ